MTIPALTRSCLTQRSGRGNLDSALAAHGRAARLALTPPRAYLTGSSPLFQESTVFIQTEATPNPATLKFLPGRPVLESGTFEARDTVEAEASPLAKALLELPGVSGVFLAPDFISVTKNDGEWSQLKPAVLGIVTEFFLSGAPVLSGAAAAADDEFFHADDSETVETIKELIETRVRPAVAGDGGDIVFKGFRDGIVYLTMKGACSGCPSSTATLRHGIENLLKHFLPDQVKSVEPA
jgi:Fe-S cluster biogenesis protein NfuA